MNIKGVYIILVFISSSFALISQESKLISSGWSVSDLSSVIQCNWKPFPPKNDRLQWENIPGCLSDNIIKEANQLVGKPFTPITSADYIYSAKTGNRTRFQDLYFGRRDQLSLLIVAECIENNGKYLEDIINGIWTICEESYWGIPAHLYLQKKRGVFPDASDPTIDLFAAETAVLLSSAAYLLEEQLNEISPLIIDRINYETDKRVLTPFLTRNDFWWLGFNRASVNNWNPWINSNILLTTFLLNKNLSTCSQIIEKVMRSLDEYVDPFPNDGGCDEGPSYWGRAGASLFESLEILYHGSNGGINLFEKPKIKNIGQYVYKAHIHENKFVNFADAHPTNHLNPSLIFRYGRMIEDDAMMQFGAYLLKTNPEIPAENFRNPVRLIPYLFTFNSILEHKAKAPLMRDYWLPDIQVMYAREKEGTHEGFFLSAKAGHNAENHNHNDVGNFILYADGVPVIIDAGVGHYTAKTFSKDRYTIWSNQSRYHNVPVINNQLQKEGRNYQADHVRYKVVGSTTILSMDIAKAYPEEAFVDKWTRKIQFKRKKEVSISESYTLKKSIAPAQWSFLSCQEVIATTKGYLILRSNDTFGNFKDIKLSFPKKLLELHIEKLEIDEEEGFAYWQNKLTRIIFTEKKPALQQNITFTFNQ